MDDMDKIRYILEEWFESSLPPLIEREFSYAFLDSKLIVSIVGVRRSGKTYLLYQLVYKLKRDIPFANIIYINFEDDRLYPLTGEELKVLVDIYKQNFSYDLKKPLYLLLDEIQNIPLWENTVRRLYDKDKNLKIIITGSSSRLLSSEISTALRGRTLTHKVFPFSFKEFLKAKNINFNQHSAVTEERNVQYGF